MKRLSHNLFVVMGLICGAAGGSAYSQCTITPAVKADIAVCSGDMVTLEASCNQGLQFNGTNHYINATNLAPLMANLDFSFSAWIKCGATSGNRTIFAVNTSSGGNRILFTLNATSGILTLFDGTTQNASISTVNDNQWHHVAFTYNKTSKQAKTYVDGTLESTLTLSGMPASGIQGASDLISLGQEFDGASVTDLYVGIMDEIRVWNKELAAIEIQNWLDKEITGSHPDYSNLIGYYKLNQYALGSIVDNASPVNDQTVNFVNASNWVSITDNNVFNPSCTYDWVSNPPGFSDSGASVSTTVNQTTTFTVTVTDGNGCTGTGEIVAVVNEIQSTNFSSNTVVCENTDLELYDLDGGGTALQFDGTNDWIEANALSDDLAGSDFTVSMWMNTSGSNENYLFSVNTSAGDNRLLLGVENSTGKILVWNQKRSTVLVNDGGWHHIAMSFNNTTKEVIVYVDGGKQFSVIMSGLTVQSSDLISIGQEYDTGSSLGNFHSGAIDEVRIWNSVRNQQEIQDWIWRELDPGQYSDMYAYYNFNEGSGTTANDLSGNGNNGTLKNGTSTANGPQWINAGWRVHSWTGPNGFTSLFSNPTISVASLLAEGTYNCSVSLLGCPGVSGNTIVDMDPVGTEPVITVVSNTCGNSAAFNLTADIPGGIWAGNGITDQINGVFDPAVAGVGQHEVIYTTTGGGCLGDDTASVNVLPEMSLTTSENTLVCDGGNMQLFSGCNHTMVFGTDDYVNIDPVAVQIANSDFTFSAWIKSNVASGSGNLFAVNTSFGDNRFLIMVNSVSGLLELYDGSAHTASSTVVNDDQWHHITVSYNKTTKQAQTYIDGNSEMLVNLPAMPTTGTSATDLVSLGQEYDPGPVASDFFTGQMEEASVWNVLLGQTEITTWMSMQLNNTHPEYTNLAAYYTFNDKDNNILYDYGPAGNNGTIINTNGYMLNDIPGFMDPCSYSWSSIPVGFTSSLADQAVTPGGIVTYYVSVSNDFACTASDSVAVAELVLQPAELSSNSEVCEGLDIELYDSTAAGNALSFDGNNDWLDISSLTNDISGSDFTFSCWFKAGPQAGSAGVLLGINDLATTNQNRLIIAISNATGKLMLYDSTVVTIPLSSPVVTDDQWRHLAVTFETGTKKLEIFLNGLLIDEIIMANINTTGVGVNDEISIGQEFDNGGLSDFFSGEIDEIRFWNTNLAQTEILDWLYRPVNNTHPQFGNLVGYYPLNESSGTTVNDESGNTNNALKKNGNSTAVGPIYLLSDWRLQNWSGPGAYSSTNQNPVIVSAAPVNGGTYDMYFTVLGCDSPIETTDVVVQPNALDPTITPAGPFCYSDAATNLTAATPGGVWSGNKITDTLLGTFDPIIAGSGMHEIIYVADDCAGSSDTINIEVLDPAVITPGGPVAFCDGQSVTLSSSSPTGNLWSTGETTQDIVVTTSGNYSVEVISGGCVENSNVITVTVNLNPAASLTATDISCNGGSDGSVDLTIGGGTMPFTFNWSNGGVTEDISGLIAGNYSVIMTDANGCQFTDDIDVNEPSAIIISDILTSPSCQGSSDGLIDISVSGGTAPYTYSWDTGQTTEDISNLSAGDYTLTVTDNAGCQENLIVTVSDPTGIQITAILGSPSSCGTADGNIDISVSGGSVPYTYSWNTGAITEDITGLAAGNYQITVTDINGCQEDSVFNLSDPSAPVISIDLVTNVLCFGDSSGAIDISVTGGTAPYNFLWNSGQTTEDISGIPAGNYDVSVTDDNGCLASANTTIGENPEMILSAISGDELFDGDGSIDLTVTGGTPPYTYEWNNGATSEDLMLIYSGTYTVLVTDANGCTDSLIIEVGSQVGFDEYTENNGIIVYPNPATESVVVKIMAHNSDDIVTIYDAAGKKVMSVKGTGLLTEVNLKALERGVYYFSLEGTGLFCRVVLQ